ncbi:MAG: hypothetical protein KGD74_06225 [Candidatus Lokiarchaeota archaeon]|nr:hypothetical protein [Candidatus Lokiarchaeota archaeon]
MIKPKKKEAESFEHLRIKEHFYTYLPLDNKIDVLKKEYPIGDRIADIYCKLSTGKKIVIEIQHSMILVKDLIQRTKEYNENNCFVLWVFNGSSFERFPKIEANVRILGFEKWCHLVYRGRVYYINMIKSGVHSPVYPAHFANQYELKYSKSGFQFYYRSLTKKSFIPSLIPSLKIKTFKNIGFNLASFYDNNVRSSCLAEITQFLNNYSVIETEVKKIKKMSRNQKTLYLIIGIYGDKYGLNLLFNILNYLKVVSKKDYSYMRVIYQYLIKRG